MSQLEAQLAWYHAAPLASPAGYPPATVKQNPILYLARRAWGQASGYRHWMVAYLLMFLAAQVISICEPWVIGRLLNAVQTGGSREAVWSAVVTGAGCYLAIQFFFWLFHGPARVMERWVAFQLRARYKARLFEQSSQLSLQWHRDNHSGETIDKIGRATSALYEFTSGSFMLVYMFLRLTSALVLLVTVVPFAGVIAMLTTCLAFALIFRFDRVLAAQYETLNTNENTIASAVQDYISNMVTVITLRLESRVLAEVKRRIGLCLPIFQRNIILNEVKWFITNMLIGVMVAGTLCAYAYNQLSSGAVLMAGTFFTMFECLRRIGESFYDFAALYGTVVRQSADVRGVEPIETSFDAQGDPAQVEPIPATWQRVSVRGVDFTYQDEKKLKHHLKDVCLELTRHHAVALVGSSGSGKSTLLTLLRGLQPPARSELAVDGRVLPLGLKHLASATTLMPQDPEIFSDTIRFNITFGMEAPEERVREAIRLARFEPVLQRLPQGLDTNIAEKGVNLSGGEKQRLALARGIFFSMDSQIVLLDEPTSAVDTFNERQIYQNLLTLYRDRCMVSAIHKLHLLPLFDRIYVFEDGQIVEAGDWATLLAAKGTLSRLWTSYQATERPEILPEPVRLDEYAAQRVR